ncbi:hypothetical protein ACHAW6_008810 [Cyclotella cf. meneghiniana]
MFPSLATSFCLVSLLVFVSANPGHRQRRRLAPDVSIITALNEQLTSGIEYPRFTLFASFGDGNSHFVSADHIEIDVVLTKPSVSQSTTFSVDGGEIMPVQMTRNILVSDHIANNPNETLSKHFAILSIDEDKGIVSGLVQKNGKLLKLEQHQGGLTSVTEVTYDPPKDWTCTVISDYPNPKAKVHIDPDERHLIQTNDNKYDHDHDHSHHNRHHNHHHTAHLNDLHHRDTVAHLGNIDQNVLRNRRRLYATDTYPNKWSYQVDLFIEIDGALVQKHDPNDAVNMPNTIAYVNALITAVSSVYEREVDTHLHVLHIAKTTLYDDHSDIGDAMKEMMGKYASQSWHYVDPTTGESPDLHHAILYRSMNAVSNIGFTFGGYWLGGNRNYIYNWIDNEGAIPFSREPKRVSKMLNYTFTDICNYKIMYDHVSTRGSCVKPYLEIPLQSCSQDSHCDDGIACSTDSCNILTGKCSNIIRDNCCGNFVCEAGESAGLCLDCGPFALPTPVACSTCYIPYGLMFDVEAITDITLTSLTFRVHKGSNSFNVYSAPGIYSTIGTNPNSWTKIASNTVNIPDNSFVEVDFIDVLLTAGSKRAFYIATSAQLAAADNNNNPLSSDDHLKILNPAGFLPRTEFEYVGSGTISW